MGAQGAQLEAQGFCAKTDPQVRLPGSVENQPLAGKPQSDGISRRLVIGMRVVDGVRVPGKDDIRTLLGNQAA